MKKLTLVFLLVSHLCCAQVYTVSETINQIDFSQDTIQSIYDWVTHNIRYDVNKLHRVIDGSIEKEAAKFKTKQEYKAYQLKQVARQKKGVCEDYAMLFHEILMELGYPSYIVEGYTKNSQGKVNRSVGHAWNAAKIDGQWKLYDATWGAGYLEEGKKFVKNYLPKWYDVQPEEMIKTHMPYDPIWQLTSTPLLYDGFADSNSEATLKDDFDFVEYIQIHLEKDYKSQLKDEVSRSESLGDGPRLVAKRRSYLSKEAGIQGIVGKRGEINDAVAESNEGVKLFNAYIKEKNRKFKQRNRNRDWAKQTLEESKIKLESALEIYRSIDVEDPRINRQVNSAIRNSGSLLTKIKNEMRFLEKTK